MKAHLDPSRRRARLLLCLTAAAIISAGCAAPAPTGPPRADVVAVTAADGVVAGSSARLAIRVTLPEGFHVNANTPRDPSLIPFVLTVQPPPGITVTEIVYPAASDLEQRGAKVPLAVYDREFAVGVAVSVADTAPGEIDVPARLRYQACDDRMCYIPATAVTAWRLRVLPPGSPITSQSKALFASIPFGTGAPPPPTPPPDGGSVASTVVLPPDPVAQLEHFSIQGTTGGYLDTDDFLAFIRRAESGARESGLLENRGLAAMLLIVLIGGLALNLTPCVLPMIPINLAIIGAGAQAGSRRRGFLLGTAYGAAMAAVYGSLGLIVILTAGTFGTINASPWFNVAIAAVFVVLALAMFDVITIDFSSFSNQVAMAGGRGSFLLAFTMGGVAALLAGACVAPVVIQVIVFSSQLYASGTTAALALPFLLGIGMALPWPVAGAGISALPKPGAWMVRVKQAFGLIILATATYYGYLAYTLFADRWVDPTEVSASVENLLKEGWHASLDEGLAAARREGKPVLVDLWATWCKNCLVMDRTTLVDPGVTAALSGYVKIKLQAENPDRPPADAVMRHFGAIGLPTYVVLKPIR